MEMVGAKQRRHFVSTQILLEKGESTLPKLPNLITYAKQKRLVAMQFLQTAHCCVPTLNVVSFSGVYLAARPNLVALLPAVHDNCAPVSNSSFTRW